MGEDTSKPKVDQSDSEIFDIAVRRDDTKPLDELAKNNDGSEQTQVAPDEVVALDEEKEVTNSDDSSDALNNDALNNDEPLLEDSFKTDDVPEELPVPSAPPTPVVADVQPVAPVVPTTRVAESAPVAAVAAQQHSNSPGTLVLQWLSYAFWGWFGTSLAVLAGITFGYFIAGSDATFWGDSLAYPLAAVIVMLVIALVTDFFYARHEPVAKKGAASVIMLIHVVLYMLTVVGALIGIVFSIIRMIITAGPTDTMDGSKVFMLTAFVTALVFGGISLRALFAGKKVGVRKTFWLAMSILALGFVVASIAGPAMKANSTKNDRLIESALPSLSSDIQQYTRTNDKLPATLSDVKSSYGEMADDQVQRIIERNLVTYKPNSRPVKTDSVIPETSGASIKKQSTAVPANTSTGTKTFYYQLCVTYKEAKSSKYDSYSSPYADYTNTTVNTYQHAKGNVCYDVSADGKYSYAVY
ncbi:US12 family protein [Microbacteriaceae bacterium]|nr:US12 family protein [Candidatus Saccharibacteria bacterium]